ITEGAGMKADPLLREHRLAVYGCDPNEVQAMLDSLGAEAIPALDAAIQIDNVNEERRRGDCPVNSATGILSLDPFKHSLNSRQISTTKVATSKEDV
ncbi:hypothetical protein LAV84_29425, partial [Rhizobium sp. VS19-DR104.2]|uniref:hypothetical protein n=1 Tax=unclassified Rhizobium TaxID=2613769 RepID=UPI001CC48E47